MEVGEEARNFDQLRLEISPLTGCAYYEVPPGTVSVARYAVPFMALCVVAAVLSLVVAGADFGKMGSDVRWVFYTALTMFVASKVVDSTSILSSRVCTVNGC